MLTLALILQQIQGQQPGESITLIQVLTSGGAVTSWVFIATAFMKGWIKKGGPCERCADRDRWIEAYMKKSDALEKNDGLIEANVEQLKLTNDLLSKIDRRRPVRREQ